MGRTDAAAWENCATLTQSTTEER
ncbi:MAG: hypothetical protein QOG18_68, partial [Microbacteriaceae bacterium]|nr:hypothetical protein [Microbacteriaceae bacterium]